MGLLLVTLAMTAVSKTMEQGKQGSEAGNRRIRRLVEALREKIIEEGAAR